MKAKITNGQIEYFKQPDWLLGDATYYALEQGFKEIIYQVGEKGIWEDEDTIYVETTEPDKLPVSKLRENAYASEKIIEWNGEQLTCDEARLNRMSVYFYSGQTIKYEVLKTLWENARIKIQEMFPE